MCAVWTIKVEDERAYTAFSGQVCYLYSYWYCAMQSRTFYFAFYFEWWMRTICFAILVFHWHAFLNFCMQIFLPLAYGVLIPSKSTATAVVLSCKPQAPLAVFCNYTACYSIITKKEAGHTWTILTNPSPCPYHSISGHISFEEMRTPYASGQGICVQKFGNVYQQIRV